MYLFNLWPQDFDVTYDVILLTRVKQRFQMFLIKIWTTQNVMYELEDKDSEPNVFSHLETTLNRDSTTDSMHDNFTVIKYRLAGFK